MPCRIYSLSRLLEEDVVQRCRHGESNDRPARPDDLLVGETDTNVPGQMPDTVQRVEEEGKGEEALKGKLSRCGPSRNSRNQRCRLEVPSSVRRKEVGESKQIQRAAESDASDSVQRRGVPGDLRPVDGQVGRNGASEALLAENLCCLSLRGRFSCCESIGIVSLLFNSLPTLVVVNFHTSAVQCVPLAGS